MLSQRMPLITLRFNLTDTEMAIVEAMKRKPTDATHDFLCLALQAGLQVLLQDAARDGLESSLAGAKPHAGTRQIHFNINAEPSPKLPPIGQRDNPGT